MFIKSILFCVSVQELWRLWTCPECNTGVTQTSTQMFFFEYCKIFKNSFFIEHIWWLLLNALIENTNVMIFNQINKFASLFLSISQQKNITKGIFLFEIIYISCKQSKQHRLPGQFINSCSKIRIYLLVSFSPTRSAFSWQGIFFVSFYIISHAFVLTSLRKPSSFFPKVFDGNPTHFIPVFKKNYL